MGRFIFGPRSLERLNTCNLALAAVARSALAVSVYDFSIIWGWRNEAEQRGMFAKGNSEKQWPNSKHNFMADGRPASLAFDFAPVGAIRGKIDWEDRPMFGAIAGVILSAGMDMGVELIWGGDWNRNGSTRDHKLSDLGHIELLRP